MLPNGPESIPYGPAAVHPNERAVLFHNPQTGEVRYPGRNDHPMPAQYKQQGYERMELPSLRAIEQFEKQHKVRSEIAWFDRGTGRGFDE